MQRKLLRAQYYAHFEQTECDSPCERIYSNICDKYITNGIINAIIRVGTGYTNLVKGVKINTEWEVIKV